MSDDWITNHRVIMKECKPQVGNVVVELLARGWRVRREGHKFALYCPCGESIIRVNGTPQNDHSHAIKIKRQAAHCPERHDLIPGPSRPGIQA
jgi:hypothetical protein